MSGSGFVQALVFGFMANPASTREEINQAASMAGMQVSTQGLDKRFTAKAALFLDEMLAEAVHRMVKVVPQTQSLLSRFNGVYIADSTLVALPSELACVFQGNNGDTDAAAKVAVQWDMQSGGLRLWLRDGMVHDQQTGIAAQALPQGALRLNDLGFFNLALFEQDIQHQRFFLSRYKSRTLVYDAHGQALDLVKTLKKQGKQGVSLQVQLGTNRLACRLIAVPVAPEKAGKRRKQLRQQAKRKQQAVSQMSLALAAWNVYVTNLSEDQLSIEEALVLAATRWQIECLFKLWKRSGLLDETRSHDPHRVWCEFYAKLMALLLQHWLMLLGCWHRLDRSFHRAFQLIRKQAFALLAALKTEPVFAQVLAHTAFVLTSTCLPFIQTGCSSFSFSAMA